mmetsp:Transcript_7102/g.26591  ORF Transcript_7102/g.26591 Transcript_7102/m.26591 type:complete len:122 (+) Transcript_7102:253-618(+)
MFIIEEEAPRGMFRTRPLERITDVDFLMEVDVEADEELLIIFVRTTLHDVQTPSCSANIPAWPIISQIPPRNANIGTVWRIIMPTPPLAHTFTADTLTCAVTFSQSAAALEATSATLYMPH